MLNPPVEFVKNTPFAMQYGQDVSERETQGLRKKKLTAEQQRVKALFFHSFRFSQGDEFFQENLFQWLAVKGYLESIEIRERTPFYIQEIVIPKKHKPLTEGDEDPDNDRLTQLEDMWFTLYWIKCNGAIT